MKFRFISVFFCCLLVVSITGCVSYMRPLKPNHEFDKTKAYIYGRFSLVPPVTTSMDGPWDASDYQTIGLLVSSENKKQSFWIKFKKNAKPCAFAVSPGTYSIDKIVFSSGSGVVESEKELESCHKKNINLKACNAYYLGDYAGEVKVTYKRTYDGGKRYTEWRLRACLDNFDFTTQCIDKSNPALAAIPKINLLRKIQVPDKINI